MIFFFQVTNKMEVDCIISTLVRQREKNAEAAARTLYGILLSVHTSLNTQFAFPASHSLLLPLFLFPISALCTACADPLHLQTDQ